MTQSAAGTYENGIYRKGNVRISDLAGRKMLPIGNSNFITCVENSVFVDKSMLIADVLDGGATATLFCRPRRFGKSLNLSMLQRFFEVPSESDPSAMDTSPLFRGLAIWDADGGRYREHFQTYPVVRISFNDAKQPVWEQVHRAVANNMAAEYRRHAYLADSPQLTEVERSRFAAMSAVGGSTGDAFLIDQSLILLTQLLYKHHGSRVVVLIDEYDAPVMAGYTYGYYDEVVAFLKTWLTGALKDNDALAFAVLTGVQRITKESIFSDLNNLKVDTALNVASDERYGFTAEEVAALAEYLGMPAAAEVAQKWYDGYRFGNVDVYNPWSVLNYFSSGCVADVYWGNTSANSVLGEMVRGADDRTWARLYALMEPGGTTEAALDLGVVFPDAGIRPGTLWSMLYLAGYLTTEDTEYPNDTRLVRRLRIPNAEIRKLFRWEIVDRFAEAAGDAYRLEELHEALAEGDAEAVAGELERILLGSASFFDLTRENSYHMLILGLLFGMRGYGDPVSNREAGRGRFDIRLAPCDGERNPLITFELKRAKAADAAQLEELAQEALEQIEARAYDGGAPGAAGVLRYGIAFSGKACAVAVSRG